LRRINDEIQRETADIIRGMKDPRVPALVSVVKTDTTRDLSLCRVFVSVYGGERVKADCMEAIAGAGGFIRAEIARRLNLRITPEMKFIADDSIEQGARLYELIRKVNAEGGAGGAETEQK
jgi:ribosome-binding factor A